MCGIAGIIESSPRPGALQVALEAMCREQMHRGPDGTGHGIERVRGKSVALGHQRLSIIDLSTDAGQPMHSPCGHYTLLFNGEVYNYRELRAELEARHHCTFRTQSDSEVILQALMQWGPAAFGRFNGMWGIAWLDRQRGELCLSRDRFGVKPLYLCAEPGRLLFASEIKSILVAAGRKFAIDAETVYRYLAYNSLDATSRTFFSGITKLPAGHYQICRLDAAGPVLQAPVRFWDFTPEDPALYRHEETLAARVRDLLQDAVSLRLRSDVPLGLLLSGGVDSSCIAALMMRLAGETKPTALAMVSDVSEFSEERFIDIVTREVGIPTRKVRLRGEPQEAWRLLREVTYHNDEPVGTFSNVAQYLLMAEARKAGITVILSGQGADEVLCGYRKYVGFYAQELLRSGRWLEAASLLNSFRRNGTVVTQFHLADAKRYLPRWLHRTPPPPFGPVVRANAVPQRMGLGAGTVNDRQRADLYEFSIPMLTHYEDRMSMAHGRETRLPFLDYRLVNLLVQAPPSCKMAQGWTKYILRRALAPLMPAEIIWRKDKQGFLNPERTWLAHELRPQLRALFQSDMLAYQSGLLDRARLVPLYEDYCRNWESHGRYSAKDVFYPLALELWLQRFRQHLAV
jgi:asparagine synthase (glutamine-hydrolysing)